MEVRSHGLSTYVQLDCNIEEKATVDTLRASYMSTSQTGSMIIGMQASRLRRYYITNYDNVLKYSLLMYVQFAPTYV